MTNQQLYLAIGIPILFNAAIAGLIIAYINAKIDATNARIDALQSSTNARIDALQSSTLQGFRAIDQRFDDMRDLWRAELHRVEEVIDARLKHLESH